MNPTARVAPMSLARLASSTLATTIVLSGCASSLSGVGSTDSYACKAPIGAQCTSVSGVYANANPLADVVPRAVHDAPLPPQGLLAATSTSAAARQTKPAPPTGASMAPPRPPPWPAPRRRPTLRHCAHPPRVMRLWIAPWEDADGDLHDASFVNVVIDTGRWLIERVRPAARSKLDIATPPLTPSASIAPAPSPETRSPADFAPTEP
jgi:conjugal transfer pilus assembly protein TraV